MSLVGVVCVAAAAVVLSGCGTGGFSDEGNQSTGRELFIGGSFNALSGSRRAGLASVDLQTAGLTAWNPGVDGAVERLRVSGNALYVMGYFGRAQGEPRFNVAAFDTASRAVLPFNPAPAQHSDLAISGDRVLLAGTYFTPAGEVSAFRWVDAASVIRIYPLTHDEDVGWF